jgi:8-oxo-dGTP pyrophosphatase MutT (NUDIX family)
MKAAHVQGILDEYLRRYPEDEDRMAPIKAALAEGTEEGLSSRNSFGHLTAGALVVDQRTCAVLQLQHLKLERWLFPGGHVEPTDPSLAEAAHRELVEEAGAIGETASLAAAYPVDIDIHPIPARPDGSEPEHLHFDFRFLFTSPSEEIELAEAEVSEFRWAPCERLGRIGERVESVLASQR